MVRAGTVSRTSEEAADAFVPALRRREMTSTRKKWAVGLLATTLAFGGLQTARALDVGSAVKIFGIGFAVKQFSGQINSFLNSALAQHDARITDSTKVVPIISIGNGGYIGAAQVMGPQSAVKQVKAVGQGELDIGSLSSQVQGLFPINTTNPLKGVKRVPGVGVSAIIDFKF
jgi:hypothetical protein